MWWCAYKGQAASGPADAGLGLELASRYAVGVKAMFEDFLPPDDLTIGVRTEAVSNLDRLRIIPVIGRLEGDAAAVKKRQKIFWPSRCHRNFAKTRN